MRPKRTKKQVTILVLIIILAVIAAAGTFLFYYSKSRLVESNKAKKPATLNQVSHITKLFGIIMDQKPIETLFVLQNDQELRPSGGFVTAVGQAAVKHGQIMDFDLKPGRIFEKNQTLKVPLDDSLAQLINTPYLTLRDANLSPDFATSMSNVLRFLRDAQGATNPQLFIAINSSANEKLLGLLGPLTFTVNKHIITVDNKNVTDTLERLTDLDYAQLGLSKKNRKQILSQYAHALLPKLQQLASKHPFTVINLALELVHNYDLQIWSSDPTIQEHLDALKTAQKVKPAPFGDTLMIVDGNFGSRKTDPFIKQKATYRVGIKNHRAVGQLLIDYKNTADETALTTTYHDYLQIFVPAKAKLLTQKGLDNLKSGHKLGLTSFSGTFSVKPKQATQVIIEFELPTTIYINDRASYTLFFKRQPGGRVFPINYIISVDNEEKSTAFNTANDIQINLDKSF